MELSSSKIKKFCIFQEMELFNHNIEVLIFYQKSFSYILGIGTFLKKLSELEKLKNPLYKNVLYFGKWNFLAPKNLLKFFYVLNKSNFFKLP